MRIGATVLAVGMLVGVATAQEGSFRTVSNPFQDGYQYRVGDELRPAVDIEGVRWALLRVAPKGERDVEADRDIPIVVELELENTLEHGVTAVVVVLLEDEQGAPLERVECEPFRLAPGRVTTERQRFKLRGDVLLGTRSVYVFCELQ